MGILSDNADKVIQLHNQGQNRSEIAKTFNCTVGAVSAFLKNRGIKLQKSNYGILENNKDKIIEMLNSGMSAYNISKQLGCGKSSVLSFIKKNRLTNKNICKVNYDDLLKDHEDEVIKLHNEGKSENEISKLLGFATSSIHILIEKLDLEKRDWKYGVDENFFDYCFGEEKTYVLGWFFSDGCVDNKGKMRIQIQKDDEEILYKIKELMKYEGPIYEVPPPKNFPNRKAQVCLCINRKSLADKLIQLGCLPNKSSLSFDRKLGTIIEEEEDFRHFVRGIFDGDGSINIKKDKYLNISITGSVNLINSICGYCIHVLGLHPNIYFKNKDDLYCQMQISMTEDAIKFCIWIYSNANYMLERKYKKFCNFINQYYKDDIQV